MKSVLARLWLVVAIALLPALGFQAYTEHQARHVRQQLVEDEALRLARLINAEQQRIVEGAEQALNAISAAPAVQDNEPERCTRLLVNLLQQSPRYSTAAVIGLDGHLLCSPLPFDRAIDMSDRAYFRLALQTSGFAIGDYVVERISGKPSIHLAKPLRTRDGSVARVIDVALSLDWLGQQLAKLPLPPDAAAVVSDRNGVVLGHFPNQPGHLGTTMPPSLAAILQGDKRGIADLKGLDGVTRLFAYAPVSAEPNGLWVAVGLDRNATFAAVTQANRIGLFLILAGVGLALALTALVGRVVIRRPLDRLVAVADRWRTGDFTARTDLPRDGSEFGRLGAAFDAMATAQQARETALAASEVRFSAMMNAIPTMTWQGDPSGTMTWFSESWQRYTGLSMAELMGSGWCTTIHPDERAGELKRIDEVWRTGEGRIWRRRIRRVSDGAWRWHMVQALPIRAADGHIIQWLGSVTDVHDLVEAQSALRERQEILQMFIERAPASLAMFDNEMRYLAVSRRYLADHGSNPDPASLIGRSHYDVRPEIPERWRDVHRRVLAGETLSNNDDTLLRADGRTDWVHWEMAPWHRADGTVGGALLFSEVITWRKRAEAALVESRAKLEAALASMTDAVLITTADGNFIHINDAFVTFHRFKDRNEALLDLPAYAAIFETVTETGEPVPFDQWPISRALRGETGVADVIRLRRKDTGESWFGSYNFAPIQDHGTTVGAVFTARDITGQLRAKEALRQEVAARETAQSVAAHAERMQALGQLAGGIAHDFNNVLQAIEGATALIERRPKDEAAVRRLARLANQAVGRGGSITRRLLAFGRRGDLRAEALDAVDLLGGIREILTHTLGAHIEVHVRLGADLPPLLADKGQLETVLVNLGTNARDAMPKGGRLTIAAESEIISLDGSAHLVGTAPRRYVRFTVTDTGTGMDAATLARAAEPFFTTKAPGLGSGLGLPMARGFAEQSGGAMHIESSPGKGTTVTLWLPEVEFLSDPSPGPSLLPGAQAASEIGNATVSARLLLVDDEESVREVLAEHLEYEGFGVLTAANGSEALALLVTGQAVDALVTDLSMPGMDGIELIRAAQQRRPGLPAVLLTGYAGDDAALALGGLVSGAFSLLRKPVRIHDLVDRVQALLEAAANRVH